MRDKIVTLEYETYAVVAVGIPVAVFVFLGGNAVYYKVAGSISVQPAYDV